jgi:hypothetical protein
MDLSIYLPAFMTHIIAFPLYEVLKTHAAVEYLLTFILLVTTNDNGWWWRVISMTCNGVGDH